MASKSSSSSSSCQLNLFPSVFIFFLISSQGVDCWFNFNDWNPSLGTTTPAFSGLGTSGLGTGDEDQIIQEPLSDSALNQLTNTLASSMSSQSSDHSSSEHASCDHDHHDHDHDHDHHSMGKVDKNGDSQDPEVQGYEKWDEHFARERKRLKKKKLAAKKSNRRGDRFFKNGRRRLNRYDDDYGHRDRGHHDHRDHDHRDHDHRDHDHRDHYDDHEDDEMGMSESRRGGLRRWFGRGRRSRPSAGHGRRYVSGINNDDDIDGGDFDDSEFGSTGLMGRLRRRLFRW